MDALFTEEWSKVVTTVYESSCNYPSPTENANAKLKTCIKTPPMLPTYHLYFNAFTLFTSWAPKTDPKRSSPPLLGNAVAVTNPALRIFLQKTKKIDPLFLPYSVHTG